MTFNQVANQAKFPFNLPSLPYSKSDLSPEMSAETFEYHHEKHHNTYVVNLIIFVEDKQDLQYMSGVDLIIFIAKNHVAGIFNNAAQVWNHTFFWHSMKKNGGGKPSSNLLSAIERDFGSFEKFQEEFKQAALTQFGSGWAWLVSDNGALKIVKTPNAETPITSGLKPLICCDVWEHAYYIDYRNRRPDFVSVFLEKLVNWDFAEANF